MARQDEGKVDGLVADLSGLTPEAVVAESTGGLELPLVTALKVSKKPRNAILGVLMFM